MLIRLVGGPGDGVVMKASRQCTQWVWQHNGRNFYYKAPPQPEDPAADSVDPAEPVVFLLDDVQASDIPAVHRFG